MKSSLAAVLALGFACAGPAFAQEVTPELAIQYLDRDGDGKCSLNEYLAFQATRLAQFDADGDGMLEYGEFKNSLQAKAKINAQRTFNAFNQEEARNALTRREFLGYHAYVFKVYVDGDNDGFMSTDEWAKVMAAN